MTILIHLVILLGAFEILSNLFHILKFDRDSIGESAKRQHQELPLDLPNVHFVVKVLLMLFMGVLMVAGGVIALFENTMPLFYALTAFALYGLGQAIFYRRSYRVWMSLLVHVLPLICLLLLW